MSARRWIALRRASQGVFLAVLTGLLLLSPFSSPAAEEAGFAIRLSPTLALAAAIAHRTLLLAFWPALLLLATSLVLGRAFCGWACPVGTLLDATDRLAARVRRRGEDGRGRWTWMPFAVLAAVLGLAGFGVPLAGWLDPLSLYARTLALGASPLVEGAGVEEAAAPWAVLALAVVLLGAVFLRPRFFCRFLCPTGALLSLGARVAPLRLQVDDACTACGACRTDCRTGAIRGDAGATSMSRCVLCLSCLRSCESRTAGFARTPGPRGGEEPSSFRRDRRAFLAGAGAGVIGGAAMLHAGPGTSPLPRIRPPGSGDEARFQDLCLRCGACVQACPTQGLAPLPLAAGIEGLWTPVLVSRKGHCRWDCHRCAEVCPSGAIAPLDAEARRRAVIGIAAIDPVRCLPWASTTPCAVCTSICPVQPRAIELSDERPRRPRVLADLCVGCGLCEKVCPVPGPAAIAIREVRG